MSSIKITLDVTKFNKSKIIERKFNKADGTEVTAKEYKVEVVPLKEPKLIKEGDGWRLMKTHFVVEEQTKEQRQSNEPKNYVGDGFSFEDTTQSSQSTAPVETGAEEINDEDIPF